MDFDIVISVIGTAILVPLVSFFSLWVKEHYKTKRLAKQESKKLDTLIECFDLYVQNNGVNQEIKDKIKTKIEKLKEKNDL